MMKKISGVSIFLALFALHGYGYTAETELRFPRLPSDLLPSVERTLSSKPEDLLVVLKNGLTVLIHKQAGNDTVSTQVFVRAGSLYENKYANAGLSHYLEHVVSGGTTSSFTEAQAMERLNRIGAQTNAFTSYDRTVYYINTSAAHWKDALDLLLSYVTECTLDPQEVTREKAVIQQEIKMGENNPDSELWRLFMKTAYRFSPVQDPVIGYEDVFVMRTREDLLDYYTSRYQPENILVAVSGEIDPLKVLEFVAEKTKNFLRRTDQPVVSPTEPPQLSSRWDEKVLPIARLTKVLVGFPSVSLSEKDVYALDVLAFLLGEGETSRLNYRIKEQEKQVLSVSASNWTPAFVRGQFMVSMVLAPEHWPGVMKTMEEEIDRFKKEVATKEELDKAKKTAIAQHIFGKETVSAFASSLASSYFDTGDPYFDEKYVEEIRNVTAEAVQDVAQRYLIMDRLSVAVTRSPSTDKDASSEKPPSKETGSLNLSGVKYEQLNNGLKVLLKPDATLPFVTIQLYGLGGLILEDSQHPGISSFTASLLTAGTRTRNKLQIARAIEDIGGSIDNGSDNNTYHVSIKVLKEDLNLALNILADIVKNAQFPEDEIEKQRSETLLSLQELDESWHREIIRLFKKSYFKDSPYGHDILGTEDSVKSFTRGNLVNFFKRMVNPHHSVLAVYGDFQPDNTMADIKGKLETWVGTAAPAHLPDERRVLTSNEKIEKKNEKVSASLFIGTNGLRIQSPRRAALDLLDTIISGRGNPSGRLFQALRGGNEDLVYIVDAFPFYGRNAGYFGVITQTTLANLDRVQNIVLDSLKRLATEPLSPKELETAKDMLLSAHKLALETLGSRARSAALNEVLGLGWKYDDEYGTLVKAVKAEDIQQLANELFSHTLIVRMIPEHPEEILAPPPLKSDVSDVVRR